MPRILKFLRTVWLLPLRAPARLDPEFESWRRRRPRPTRLRILWMGSQLMPLPLLLEEANASDELHERRR